MSSILDKIRSFIQTSIPESVRMCVSINYNHWLTACKRAELASQKEKPTREPGREEKILSDNRQDGNVVIGGIGNL